MKSAVRFLQQLFGGALAIALLASASFAQYVRTDLSTNVTGAAPNTDARLLNPWGLVALPTSPYWAGDNMSGFSTLHRANGDQVALFVRIPTAPGSPAGTLGTPTGVVGNISPNATDFVVSENGKSGKAAFIFNTLDGTISGWNPAVSGIAADGTQHATLMVYRSSV